MSLPYPLGLGMLIQKLKATTPWMLNEYHSEFLDREMPKVPTVHHAFARRLSTCLLQCWCPRFRYIQMGNSLKSEAGFLRRLAIVKRG